MLTALIDDLLVLPASLPAVELTVMADDRMPPPGPGGKVRTAAVGAEAPFREIWKNLIAASDAVWPIAPESGGILERLCRDVEDAGKVLLTSPSAAVRVAGSKRETLDRLRRSGLPVARTLPLHQWRFREGHPCVIKPDDGAGCEGARIVRDSRVPDLPRSEGIDWIAQDLIEGDSLSLSALFAQGEASLLSCNRQRIERRNEAFFLAGCRVNALPDADGRWQALASGVAKALPELWGYAGVDLIQGEDGPVILEINPRLTTSYAGIRQATAVNPAAEVLDLLKSGRLPAPRPAGGRTVEIELEAARGH